MLFFTLTACAHPQLARPAVTEVPVIAIPGSDLAFYDVHGSSGVEVVESLVNQAPEAGGIRHAAVTEWGIVWRYPSDTEDSSASAACDLDHVLVDVTILTLFPRWSPPIGANPEDVSEWWRYALALADHETVHVRIIDDLANSIPEALRAGGCEGADQRGLAVLDEIRARSSELDTETLDGTTTGAQLAWVAAAQPSGLF
ncbi:MAG: DUF922 domain-containing protein [Myxococcales bacterium]|nr:DUF922 domain-containing protein [Myxococcales bacterium]